jgi:hypothetical protein
LEELAAAGSSIAKISVIFSRTRSGLGRLRCPLKAMKRLGARAWVEVAVFISDERRKAGFWGCTSDESVIPLLWNCRSDDDDDTQNDAPAFSR